MGLRQVIHYALAAVASVCVGCSGDQQTHTDGERDAGDRGFAAGGAGGFLGNSDSGLPPLRDGSVGGSGKCEGDRACGDGCCLEYEDCLKDKDDNPVCAACGGDADAVCGDTCCEGATVCYLGQCVAPGADCNQGTCATKEAVNACADGEICDSTLGKCMPSEVRDTCIYEPPPQVFDPVPRFTWGARKTRACSDLGGCQTAETCESDVCTITWPHVGIPVDGQEAYGQVSSTPMVADLDGDCVPEIIFNSYKGTDFGGSGVVRAIRGDDGSKVWTSDPAVAESDGSSNLAVGDIDSDGLPEVVAQGLGKHLVAWDSDGSVLWISADTFSDGENSGSVSIANMDGEGDPEIIFGSAIFASDGTRIFQRQDMTGGSGFGYASQSQGPISCIADLDGDGRPELIGGKTAYRFTGTLMGGDFGPVDGSGTADLPYWDSAVGDGKCGVADFDNDGKPEVVLVRSGNIHVLNGQTGVELSAPHPIPGGGSGGAPNIADFDGDGTPDIGTAGGNNYVVVQFNGSAFTQLWQADTQDGSSNVTGSSVFDFDGDGSAEVVYNDELYLRIYPGVEPDCKLSPQGPACDGDMTDAEVLFKDLNGSRTRTEYPVVADVDGDFKAELVFSTNNDSGDAPDGLGGTKKLDQGIEVWEDRLDNWVGTRPIWNQHTYHVTNVDVSGGIPMSEPDNWDNLNHYRNNDQGGQATQCAPDLVPFDLRAADCKSEKISARVVNLGCLGVGSGVKVSFYADGDELLGTVETSGAIGPGAGETVSLETGKDLTGVKVWVVLDDDGQMAGGINECKEDNNTSEPTVCRQAVIIVE